MAWIDYKRSDAMKGAGAEFVSLRPMGIAFSAGFVQGQRLASMTRVSLVFDHGAHRLGFRFHSDENDVDAFALTPDGGGGSGRWMQSKRIYVDIPWLGAVLKSPAIHRRFRPVLADRVWSIKVRQPAEQPRPAKHREPR